MNDVSLLAEPPDVPATGKRSSPFELICVCCNCDRIRSRSGTWREDHTPLPGERRSHGICPDCFATLYPEFAQAAPV